jgi:hypothetical protein
VEQEGSWMKHNQHEILDSVVRWIEWEAQPEKITVKRKKENHN